MKLFKKKDKYPTESVPRSVEELTRAFTAEAAKAGQAQYQILVYTEELRQINERLLKINQEADKRQKLDKAARDEAARNAARGQDKGAANV